MPNSDVVATGSSSANAVGVGVMLELPTPVTVYSVPQVVNLVYLTQVYQ
jgi:hypothetical protein